MTAKVLRNPRMAGMECIRCGERPEGFLFPEGCPACLRAGKPSALRVVYEGKPAGALPGGRGMRRFASFLPFLSFPSLGEGGTPLLGLDRWASRLGLSRFWLKWEGMNPTGSHKDRMSPLIAAGALMEGKRDVVIASSGNAGLSLAAYAGSAGLLVHVIVTRNVPGEVREWIRLYGGKLRTVDTPEERWRLMRKLVEEEGYYPAGNFSIPAVGSHPFGVQGLKTIAHEIVLELGEAPDAVVVPVSRGDVIRGVWEGFRECLEQGQIRKLPRLAAVEPFPRLARVLAGEAWTGRFAGSTRQASIDGFTVTWQAVSAVIESGGTAVAVTDEEAMRARGKAAREGILLELSSASVLAAAEKLARSGWFEEGMKVAAVATSHGFKERSL